MLMNSAKGQSYIFYWFLVNKGKTNKAGGGGNGGRGAGIITPSPSMEL